MIDFRTRISRLDEHLADRASSHDGPLSTRVLPPLSNAANRSGLWLGLAAAAALTGGRRGRRLAQRAILSIGVTSAVTNAVLKPLLPRPRPAAKDHLWLSLVRRPSSSSFPSGHAASAAAFATATALEAPPLAPPAAALAAAVAYSRVSTGVHYPSDVVVGALTGTAVALATVRLWPRIDPSPAAAPGVAHATAVDDTTGKGLVVIANAGAGSSRQDDQIRAITDALPACRVELVDDHHDLGDALERAARDDATEVLGVLGGDGTIGAAAQAALDAGCPLAVFPGGTLNHFARDLGIADIDDAIAVVRAGHVVEIDTATIDDRLFLNTASFGPYAEFVRMREKYERRLGKWPAVAVALGRVLRRAEPIELEIDGEARRIWMIFIGNCRYQPFGFAPATRNDLADGRLDVRIVDADNPGARVRLVAAVLTGRLARSAVYEQFDTDQLAITVREARTDLAADGEVFDGNARFTVRKRDRLRILAR